MVAMHRDVHSASSALSAFRMETERNAENAEDAERRSWKSEPNLLIIRRLTEH